MIIMNVTMSKSLQTGSCFKHPSTKNHMKQSLLYKEMMVEHVQKD
jgi:hypothetical protein